jgi:hypothetical protein
METDAAAKLKARGLFHGRWNAFERRIVRSRFRAAFFLRPSCSGMMGA